MEGYQLSTSEYAKREGVSAMTVRRWKNKGAPLDDPEAMRVFRVNEKSRTGISKSNHRHTSSLTSCVPDQPKSSKKTKVNRPHAEVGKHIGMRPNIRRLQGAELRRFNDYQAAEASDDIAVVKACQELWLNASEQLRRAEATNPEVEKSNKESVSIAEVVIEVHRAYGAVRSALDALPDRLIHKIVGLDASAALAIAKQEIALICRHLVEWEDLKREQSEG
jgi:phage terminase Nu1 subunit (DNA packaging protein)